MTQAIGDPDELKHFACPMRKFVDSFDDAVGIPQRRFHMSRRYLAERRMGMLIGLLPRANPPVAPVAPVQSESGRADPVASPEVSS